MEKILFQGDSITDAGRCREDDRLLGYGYATMTAGVLSNEYPGRFIFVNRGISGDRTVDVYARIKRDIINLKPDYMSILLGVNDVWHEFAFGDGVAPAKMEDIYDRILRETMTALPGIKIILLEPFLLPGSAAGERYEEYAADVWERARIVKKLAEKYSLPFVPLQEKLNEMAEKTSDDYVLMDGVHPTYAGHRIITQALCEAYRIIL